MTGPAITLRVDWYANSPAVFTPAICTVKPLSPENSPGAQPLTYQMGRSGDYTTDTPGQLTFTLANDDNSFTPDRNWCDAPSFEVASDFTAWSTAAIASLTAAATSITTVVDNAPGAGSAAASVVLPATLNAGVTYAFPSWMRFRNGFTYSFAIYLKSISGTTSIQCGMASSGTPTDIATAGGTITGAWVQYAGTWTPTADRTDAVAFVRSTAASAATVRMDAVQVNPGATLNVYVEAPTRGQLIAGRPVHMYVTSSAVQYALFYGYIQRISPDVANNVVNVTVYDQLWKYDQTDAIVPANPFVQRCARDMRIAALEDFERGALNLLPNPSFETNTSYWTFTGTSFTRVTNDAAPGAGTCCAEWITGGVATVTAIAYMAPAIIAGLVYRFSVWLRVTSGTTSVTLGLTNTHDLTVIGPETVTLTTTWQRFTLATAAANTYSASGSNSIGGSGAFAVTIASTGAATIHIDAAQLTRGEALYPYADVGTGRWPNFCLNGGFDGQALSGWYDSFTNLCTNGNFETNATGWTNVSQSAAQHFIGSDSGSIGASTTGSFAFSGTFVAGIQYGCRIAVMNASSTATIKLGSSGTPADTVTRAVSVSATFVVFTLTWTPSANRTDGLLQLVNGAGGSAFIDAVGVFRLDPSTSNIPQYSDTGPGGGGSFTTTRAISTTTVKWGGASQNIVSPATSGAGRLYDFNHCGAYFVKGVQYVISVWLNATTAMPYKVGIAHNLATGAWEDTSTTGTLTANTWTQVTLTWTPAADASSANPYDVVLYIHQTNATARTWFLDGVRVIPGSAADNFEEPYWTIPAVSEVNDVYTTSATVSGSALQCLTTLNGWTFSRHYTDATMSSPWFQYTVVDRNTLANPTNVEHWTNDQAQITNMELDYDALFNVFPIAIGGTTMYYSDGQNGVGVTTDGPRIASQVGASYFQQATADSLGAYALARYGVKRRRPTILYRNRWPATFQRNPVDVVRLQNDARLIESFLGEIQRMQVVVTNNGNQWDVTYQLEELPFADAGS